MGSTRLLKLRAPLPAPNDSASQESACSTAAPTATAAAIGTRGSDAMSRRRSSGAMPADLHGNGRGAADNV